MHFSVIDPGSGSDLVPVERRDGADTATSSVGVPRRNSACNISIATGVGLFIAAVLPFISPFLPLIGPPADPGAHITHVAGRTAEFTVESTALNHFAANVERGLILKWVRSAALLLLVLLWERKPLASIGWRKISWRDFLVVVGAYLLILGIGRALDFVVPKHLPSNIQLATMLFPFRLRVGMVLTAAVTEEIDSRGYLIERLQTITGSASLAAVLAYFIFLFEHFASWDLAHALRTTLWIGPLILIYLWRRNLPVCMSLHFFVDATAFLIA